MIQAYPYGKEGVCPISGAIYRVRNRGDHQEAIFNDERDRQQFLRTLAQTRQKAGWHVHSFCLMPITSPGG